MTATLRKRISNAGGLREALDVLHSEHASGALIVKAADAEGSIAFIEARIVGAAVSPSGERGEEALEKLIELQDEPLKLRYLKFYGMHSSGKVEDMPIEQFLNRLSKSEPAALGDEDPVGARRGSASLVPCSENISAEPAAAPEPPPQQPTEPQPSTVKKPFRPKRKIPVALLTAIAALGSMSFCTIWIPAQIKSTAGGGTVEERAILRLKRSLHDTLASDGPQSSVLVPNRPRKIPSAEDAQIIAEPMNEDLRFARYLVNKGKIDEARQYYESYVRLFPNSIKPRLELVNVYLATNNRAEARIVCLRTLKKQLTSDQVGSVWQLLAQCQMD
jgi:hypothetical protein